MVLNGAFVISRNVHKRPTLIHKVNVNDRNTSLCGIDMRSWSKHYMRQPFEELLCLRCKPMSGGK